MIVLIWLSVGAVGVGWDVSLFRACFGLGDDSRRVSGGLVWFGSGNGTE